MHMRARSGFTLLEMIIYIGITAVVVVSLMNIMITVFETRERTENVSEVQQSARLVMDRITNTLTYATDVEISSDGDLITTKAGEQSPVVFSVRNRMLFVQRGSQAAKQLTPDTIQVTNLQFRSIDAHAVDIYLTISNGTDDSITLVSTITLRQ